MTTNDAVETREIELRYLGFQLARYYSI